VPSKLFTEMDIPKVYLQKFARSTQRKPRTEREELLDKFLARLTPSRFKKGLKLITHALLAGKFQGVPTSDLYPFYNECDEAKNFSITLLVEAQAEGIEGVTESATESRV